MQNGCRTVVIVCIERSIDLMKTQKSIKLLFYRDCNDYNVLGFDCEWVPMGNRKVAMLQLASNPGLCALVRLCKLEKIPNELRVRFIHT